MSEPRLMLLDCTLRDGGYQNNWQFGRQAAAGVLRHLTAARTAFVECGFITDGPRRPGQTLFAGRELAGLLPQAVGTRFVAMAVWGDCSLAGLPPAAETGLFGLRLSFDRHQTAAALAEVARLRRKGYAVFLQPVRLTTNYTPGQRRELLARAAAAAPYAFYLVDSLGALTPEQAADGLREIDNALGPDIRVGFHGHNHRGMAMACALAVAYAAKEARRPCILDSCLGGMGKAAGNVCTEHLVQQFWPWRLEGVLAALDALGPLQAQTAYFVASVTGCNTGYVQWLMENGVDSAAGLHRCLTRLAAKSRPFFCQEAAENLL